MQLLFYLFAGLVCGLIMVGVFDSAFMSVLLGVLGGWVFFLSQRLKSLEVQLNQLKQYQPILAPPHTTSSTLPASATESLAIQAAMAMQASEPLLSEPFDSPAINQPLNFKPEVPKQANFLDKGLQAAKNWLFGGNIFVRLGIMLLFFGVVFLLRYSLERNLIPIELRLAGSAAGALALLGLGWRLRKRKGAYGLILQAGGIGILYLTVFGAFSLYHVIPALPAFLFMVVIVVLAAALAVLQNSFPLAAFATVGGFLAPLLTSSSSNNYIGLFSFYALLNLGIVAIAWFKSWRLLNLIGFVFTFVIATVWGWFSYQADNFATVEPFLILFFLLYVAIAILFATRTPINFKDKVDSTLVFGVPLIGFGMQIALVRDFEYGIALSSLVLGAFYLLLSMGLWKGFGKTQQLLTESFLSLGVIFTTLAIPFAVDGALTSAAWALEGAGILWISIRQQQFLRRLFGLFLQYAALLYWLVDVGNNLMLSASQVTAFFNGPFIALVLISSAMLLSSYLLSQKFPSKSRLERPLPLVLLLTAGIAQWLSFELESVLYLESVNWMLLAHVVYLGIWTSLLLWLARFSTWIQRRFLLLVPIASLITTTLYTSASQWLMEMNKSDDLYRWISLVLAFGMTYIVLYRYEAKNLFSHWLRVLQPIVAWLLIFAVHNEIVAMVARYFAMNTGWLWASFAVAGLSYLALSLLPTKRFWPFTTHHDTLLYSVSLPLAGLLGLWLIQAGFSEGLSTPLPWLPVLNPLDMLVMLLGSLLVKLYYQLKRMNAAPWFSIVRYSGVALGFYWLNSFTLHLLHYWGGFAWDIEIITLPTTQTTLAIVWALSGLALAWRGHQKLNRPLWTAGVVLLGVVVLKLFLVDFASSGTLARVISFISVGVLLLFIGYLAPLPPANAKQVETHV